MKVKKAIIPAAGLGTRVLPASKAVPKEMLNIVDKPAIQYLVEEAVAAALEKVMSAIIPILPMLGIQIVLHIVAGFIANPLYKRSVTAKVQKLRAAFPDDRAFEAATMRKGGTSILLAFASYIGYYIIYNLLLYAAELLIK